MTSIEGAVEAARSLFLTWLELALPLTGSSIASFNHLTAFIYSSGNFAQNRSLVRKISLVMRGRTVCAEIWNLYYGAAV
jgi:hypothetical protein